jgi:hypothetical protein
MSTLVHIYIKWNILCFVLIWLLSGSLLYIPMLWSRSRVKSFFKNFALYMERGGSQSRSSIKMARLRNISANMTGICTLRNSTVYTVKMKSNWKSHDLISYAITRDAPDIRPDNPAFVYIRILGRTRFDWPGTGYWK